MTLVSQSLLANRARLRGCSSPRCSSCRRCCSSWAVARSGRTLPGQSPGRFAEDGRARSRDGARARPAARRRALRAASSTRKTPIRFSSMLTDGTVITSGSRSVARAALGCAHRCAAPAASVPPSAAAAAAVPTRSSGRSTRRSRRASTARRPRRDPPRLPLRPRARTLRPPVADRASAAALAGVVVVPPQAPFGFLLRALRADAGARSRPASCIVGTRAGVGDDFRSGAPAAARARDAPRAGSAPATCRRARPTRGGDEIAAVASGVQRDGRRPGRARRRARRVGSGPPAAARRRLARADDAGHRDARLPRDADDAGADARRGDARRAIWRSSATRPAASSASSATCSTWRGSKAAAARCSREACRWRSCSIASPRATSARRSRPA